MLNSIITLPDATLRFGSDPGDTFLGVNIGTASMVAVDAGEVKVHVTVSEGQVTVEVMRGLSEPMSIVKVPTATPAPLSPADEALDALRRKLAGE